MKKIALLYNQELEKYKYAEYHPLKRERIIYTMQKIKKYSKGAYDNFIAKPASIEEMSLYHDADYIKYLYEIENDKTKYIPKKYEIGTTDNPYFKGIFSTSSIHIGAVNLAADLIVKENYTDVFYFPGGLHHAKKNYAWGFCFVNDPVYAILRLLNYKKRVLYIDIDAHFCDGVADAFKDDYRNKKDLLILSFHESGDFLFPGEGYIEEKSSINFPLYPGTDDYTYLLNFTKVFNYVFDKFRPDVLVVQIGADSSKFDILSHLNLSLKGYLNIIKIINGKNANKIWLGGGGYNNKFTSCAWSSAFRLVLGDIKVGDIKHNIKDLRAFNYAKENYNFLIRNIFYL
ncbi:MAG: arginase family protein [bacterium]